MATTAPTADTTVDAIPIPSDWLAQDSVSSLEFCPVQHQPNTDFLAVGAWDGSVRIFKVTSSPGAVPSMPPTVTNVEPWHLYNHQGPVLSLAWSFDGLYLFSGSEHGSLLGLFWVWVEFDPSLVVSFGLHRRRGQDSDDVQSARQDAEPGRPAQRPHQRVSGHAANLGSPDARHGLMGSRRQNTEGQFLALRRMSGLVAQRLNCETMSSTGIAPEAPLLPQCLFQSECTRWT